MSFIHSILNDVHCDSGTDLSLEATVLGEMTLSRPVALSSLQLSPWEPKISHGKTLSCCRTQNIGRGHGTRNL